MVSSLIHIWVFDGISKKAAFLQVGYSQASVRWVWNSAFLPTIRILRRWRASMETIDDGVSSALAEETEQRTNRNFFLYSFSSPISFFLFSDLGIVSSPALQISGLKI
ncbi:hypothetical protein MRB53_034708 [Persea americana]|uniref:Uncharacterized protein n=1 Tax=Persea americana TaxID=3435 RepID=A0ACC2K2N5_PERAE|nr:hypothetical protein MRB53_034708 [Persea americana]